jgi:hypothetical protein
MAVSIYRLLAAPPREPAGSGFRSPERGSDCRQPTCGPEIYSLKECSSQHSAEGHRPIRCPQPRPNGRLLLHALAQVASFFDTETAKIKSAFNK